VSKIVDIAMASIKDRASFIATLKEAKANGLISEYCDEPLNGCYQTEIPKL